MAVATQLFLPPSGVPRVWTESAFAIRAEAVTTTTHVAADLVDVSEARRLSLLITIDGADSSGTVQMLLGLANEDGVGGAPPLTTADVWYPGAAYDGSVTVVDPAGSILASTDWTFQPEWAKLTLRPGFLEFEAIEAATDEIRIRVKVDVEDARWFYCSVNSAGAGTLPGVAIKACRSL